MNFIRCSVPKTAGSFLFTLTMTVTTGWASSLKANIGELLLRNLQVGQTYDLVQLTNLPLRISYEANSDAVLLIDPHVPDLPEEMKAGFEPIPDASWVSISPSRVDIGQEASVEAQVKVTIPDNDAYLGKKYVVYLWTRTQNKHGGITVGLGAKSRLLLVISPDRVTTQEEEAPPAQKGSLNFRVEPQEIKPPTKVALGRKYSLEKLSKQKIVVMNLDEVDRTFHLTSILGSDLSVTLPAGWEWPPDGMAVTFASDTVKVSPRGQANVKVLLQLPKNADFRGKRFLYIIRVSPQGKGVTSGVISRIYVETKP